MTFTEMYSYTQPGQVTKKKMRVAKYFDRPYPYQGMWAQAELEGRQEYDNEGRVTRMTYPAATGGGGQSYDYGYDGMGRLKTMQDPNDPFHGSIISDATYGPAGEMLTMSGVVNETRTYNSRLQLSTFNSTTYNYGTTANNGRIVSETNSVSGETVTYQYDELNRLLKAETVATPGWGQQFTYDAFGNLTGKSGTPNHAAAPTMTLVVSRATNRVGGYTYDANGNQLTTATQGGLSYDFENRMVASDNWNNTGMKYGYDPDNRRVYGASWSYNNGTGQYTYTNQLVYYWSAAGQRLASYALTLSAGTPPSVPPSVVLTWSGDRVYFGGKLLRREGPAWTGEDRLGSVGQYYPYGEARGTDQGRFATYDRDAGGLDYAINRWYSSPWGRFTSPDPTNTNNNPAAPLSWNRYIYVNSDPINANDPFGTFTSTTAISGICPVPEGEKIVYVPCVLLSLNYKDPTNEMLETEWDNLPDKCKDGLKAKYGSATRINMMKNLNRAIKQWKVIETAANAHGIDFRMLAAIGLKESNFTNQLQYCPPGTTWGDPNCSGAGVFQIDLNQNKGVSKDEALDLSFAANWAANLLSTNMEALAAKFPTFTGDELLQATAASYNLGVGGISGDPETIDIGTRGTPKNSYGANVLQLMECFR